MFSNVAVKGLYERLGGDVLANATTGMFYQKMLKDPLLAPVLNVMDREAQEAACLRFVQYALSEGEYHKAQDIFNFPKRHTVPFKDEHFDAILRHFADSLVLLKVPAVFIRDAAVAAESARKAVLAK